MTYKKEKCEDKLLYKKKNIRFYFRLWYIIYNGVYVNIGPLICKQQIITILIV